MYLEKIRLQNFKNYEALSLKFSPFVNCITGKNGAGKTNLLDAIAFLCLTKSALNKKDRQLCLIRTDYFAVEGDLFNVKSHNVLASFKKNGGKNIQLNQVEYEKMSDHIGKFPVVFVSPYDVDLVREGSEERRKFFDNILSQSDDAYLKALMEYNHVLKQRNALLKQFSDTRHIDNDLLDPYDNKIIDLSHFIYEKRQSLIDNYVVLFHRYYQDITKSGEWVELKYKSEIKNVDFRTQFKQALEKDIFLQRTTLGVHKDDYLFLLSDEPIKRFGSQGQQKSFTLALQLAKLELIKQKKGVTPILLLDDVFDKLDDHRMRLLINMIARGEFGQVFITEADASRVEPLFGPISGDVSHIKIDSGKVIEHAEKI